MQDKQFVESVGWLDGIIDKLASRVANCFILEGNTTDYYQYLGEKLRGCLINTLMGKQVVDGSDDETSTKPLFGLIVTYSRNSRFAFPNEKMKNRFIELANKSNASVKLPTTLTPDNLNVLVGQYGTNFALTVLNNVLSYNGSDAEAMAAIIEYADTLVPATEHLAEADRTSYTLLSDWAKDQITYVAGNIGRQHHLVLLISEESGNLYQGLRRTVREVVTIPMPDVEIRLAAVEAIQRQIGIKLALNVTPDLVARLTAGLTITQIEDVFLMATLKQQPVSRSLINWRKEELIRAQFGDVLSIHEPERTFADLGGLATQKAYLLQHVVGPMQSGRTGRVPNGIILPGPAGTGKTVLAEALAGEVGCTFIKFNLAKIKDKYVGQSERNMQRALDTLSVISPAVVLIDEIDQVLGQSREAGGDGGVSGNLFAMLLAWAADTRRRGKVLLVAATNRPDLLDAALAREGRFDLKVPILAPEPEERPQILAVQLARYFKGVKASLPSVEELAALTANMENYTGAILERVASLAFGEWEDGAGQLGVLEAVRLAAEALLPTTPEIAAMTKLALDACSDIRVLPPRYREQVLQSRQKLSMQNQSASRLGDF